MSGAGLLYVILDAPVISEAGGDIFSLAAALAGYKIDIFQFRFKNMPEQQSRETAKKLAVIMRKQKKLFIINDRPDIALLSSADGVHLGRDDMFPDQARRLLGKDKIIGKTTHSLSELSRFQKEDVDYLSVGPVFKTKTKPAQAVLSPETLGLMVSRAEKPVFAIGGINLDNAGSLFKRGIRNIALCRAVISSKNCAGAVEGFRKCLKEVS